MTIIKRFYQLSLLKINLEKTKAVHIGSSHNSAVKWCEEENLDWCNTFKLLGINFHNNLENMDLNFYEKIGEIDAALKFVQYSTFGIQNSIFNIQNSIFKIQHSTFKIQNSMPL